MKFDFVAKGTKFKIVAKNLWLIPDFLVVNIECIVLNIQRSYLLRQHSKSQHKYKKLLFEQSLCYNIFVMCCNIAARLCIKVCITRLFYYFCDIGQRVR